MYVVLAAAAAVRLAAPVGCALGVSRARAAGLVPGVAWEGLCAAVATVPGRLVSRPGWPAAAAGGAPAAKRGAATNMATMAATNTAAGCMLQEARRDVGRES